MKWLTTPYGRKNLEAYSGLLLLAFMVEHFLANLMLLFNDPEPYRWYTETMGRLFVVRGLEVALFALFILHIGVGLYMRAHHRRFMRLHPQLKKPSDLATRYVGLTGGVILIFLVVHLARFFWPNRVQQAADFDLYEQANIAFSSLWYTLFYVFAMAALAFHLKHGIRSALFSIKIVPKKYIPRIKSTASWVGFLMSVGLAYIAIHVYVRQTF